MKKTLVVCTGAAGLGLLLALVAYAFGYRKSVPAAAPIARTAPSFDRLPRMKVCWIESAHAAEGVRHAGEVVGLHFGNTASGLVVSQPAGTLLLDAGDSMHFDDEVAGHPFLVRLWLKTLPGALKPSLPFGDLLRSAGIDPATLRWALLSHSHLDHAGGLMDLPGVPILIPQEELDFIRGTGFKPSQQIVPAIARMLDARAQPLHFEAKRYEIFDESADLFGDGSVVVVKLSGHTPGSVGTFVNLSPTRRLFHVGDAVQDTHALTARVGKPPIMAGTDVDAAAADLVVARLAALQELVPSLQIIPAHGRDAWLKFFGQPGCTQ
jgi:glyoxylase-like metal-dependent hydrolase (beta-lactamase superfamily II)